MKLISGYHPETILLNELTVIENTYVSKKEEVTGILKQFCKEKFRDLHSSLTVVMVVKSRKMR